MLILSVTGIGGQGEPGFWYFEVTMHHGHPIWQLKVETIHFRFVRQHFDVL